MVLRWVEEGVAAAGRCVREVVAKEDGVMALPPSIAFHVKESPPPAWDRRNVGREEEDTDAAVVPSTLTGVTLPPPPVPPPTPHISVCGYAPGTEEAVGDGILPVVEANRGRCALPPPWTEKEPEGGGTRPSTASIAGCGAGKEVDTPRECRRSCDGVYSSE